jgi:hypothetical protein
VCLLLQNLLQTCSRGGRGIGEDRCYQETTSKGLCGLVCPSRTSQRGREGDCVKEGEGEEGERERERGCHDSLDVAVSYMGLGDVYESLGKFEEALEMHTKSLDIQTRIHGGDHHSRYCATAHDI